MNKQQQLSTAIRIASQVHEYQFDKGGKSYILHPLRLMMQLMFDIQLATIAILHDVIEDSDGKITLKILMEMGFSKRVLEGIEFLTHYPKDDYLKVYIPRICLSYDAIRVKRKDLGDNSDITRLKGVGSKDIVRIEKYHKAFLILGEAKRKFEEK